MLDLAIKAGLPLIAVQTTDTVNFRNVIQHLVGIDPDKMSKDMYAALLSDKLNKRLLYMVGDVKPEELDMLYTKLVKAESSLIVVNPKVVTAHMVNAGALPVPKELVKKFLDEIYSAKVVEVIIPSLGGLTLKEIVEVVKMTEARDKKISADGILKTRRNSFSAPRGVEQVPTSSEGYVPPKALVKLINREKSYFLHGQDHRLRSRGVLFDGPPGTGKTAGAKYLASEFGIPLFRLDLSGMMTKWHGESENNLSVALQQVDAEEPCVLLIDEVEKVLSQNVGSDSTGVSNRILSSILWWLQEHRSRVFVVMTCNNKSRIPPELYREGRLDGQLYFSGLGTMQEASNFANWVASQFDNDERVQDRLGEITQLVAKEWNNIPQDPKFLSQSAVTSLVYRFIKDCYVDQPDEPEDDPSKVVVKKAAKAKKG